MARTKQTRRPSPPNLRKFEPKRLTLLGYEDS